MQASHGHKGLRISLATLFALILGFASMQANAMMMEYWDVDSTGWDLDDGFVGGELDVIWDLGTPGFTAGSEYGLGSGNFEDKLGFTPGTADSASFKMWLNGGGESDCEIAIDTDDSCGAVIVFDLFSIEGSQFGVLGGASFVFGDFLIPEGSLFAAINESGLLAWEAFEGFGGEGASIEAVALMVTAYEKDAAVPAPSVLGLFAIGLLGLGFIRRRKV